MTAAQPGGAEHLMGLMDEVDGVVATMTGVRQKFIDAGWSTRGAEEMVVTILRSGAGQTG